MRLEKLLGLPPNSGKTKFVEIWVRPQDLFRPSPDPEITDCVAELDCLKPEQIALPALLRKTTFYPMHLHGYHPVFIKSSLPLYSSVTLLSNVCFSGDFDSWSAFTSSNASSLASLSIS